MILALQVVSVICQLLASGLKNEEAVTETAEKFGLDTEKIKKYL